MKKDSQLHPIHYARQHYERVRSERHRLDLRYRVHQNHSIGHRLLGHKRPNQHTVRRFIEHFGPWHPDQWWQARLQVSWLHGRICIPHPAVPEAFELACWITYADAVAITGRSPDTFARWRWDQDTQPDEAVWRLLEWHCHGCCAWPPRPLRTRSPDDAGGDLEAKKSPHAAG